MALRRAWLAHFAAALLGVLILALLASWDNVSGPASLASVGQQFVANVEWLLDETARDPKFYLLAILGIALLIEVGFAGVAYLIMPWGAFDEPLAASFRHALRRTWLQTPHVVLIIAAVGAVAVPLLRADRASRSAYPVPMPEMTSSPPFPSFPPGAAPNSQAMKNYEKSMDEYDRVWQAHWKAMAEWRAGMRMTQPWYIRFGDAIGVDLGFLSSLWLLGALLRSAGAPRVVPPIERPPQCDACGYNLTSIPLESRCPECGEPVAASLGPDARLGPPWMHRRKVGCFTAWRRSCGDAIRNPVCFGRTLRLASPGVDHRRFLAIHLPLVFLIGLFCPTIMFLAVERRGPTPNELESIIIGGPIFGTLCTTGVVAVSLLTAATMGIQFQIHDRRNLLLAAVQVVSYLVPYLFVWQMIGAATAIIATLIAKNEWFIELTYPSGLGPEGPAFLLWFIPNFACGIWYWMLVKKAVAATRYANR